MPEHDLTFEQLSAAFESLADVAPVSAGIGSADPEAAAYARTLEYGSVAGEKPWPSAGPRTTRAVNPETGEEVIVSAQAPQGFVRVHSGTFARLLTEQLQNAGGWLDAAALQHDLAKAVHIAAQQALDLLRDTVPEDSGQVAQSLHVINANFDANTDAN